MAVESLLIIERKGVSLRRDPHPDDKRFTLYRVYDKDQLLREFVGSSKNQQALGFFQGYCMAKNIFEGTDFGPMAEPGQRV